MLNLTDSSFIIQRKHTVTFHHHRIQHNMDWNRLMSRLGEGGGAAMGMGGRGGGETMLTDK